MSPEWISLDFETSSVTKGSICQIGLSVFTYNGSYVESWGSFVKPPGNIYDRTFLERNNAIQPSQTVDAPSWKEIAPTLEKFTAGRRVVCHNAHFDMSHWQAAAKKNGTLIPSDEIFACSLRAASALFPSEESHKLGDLAKSFGIDYDAYVLHDAKEDSYIAGQLWITMAEKVFSDDPITSMFSYHDNLDSKAGRVATKMAAHPPSTKQVNYLIKLLGEISILEDNPIPQNPDMIWPLPSYESREAWLYSLDKNKVSNLISEIKSYPPPSDRQKEKFEAEASHYCRVHGDYGTAEPRGDGTWNVEFMGISCVSRYEPTPKNIIRCWMENAGSDQYDEAITQMKAYIYH